MFSVTSFLSSLLSTPLTAPLCLRVCHSGERSAVRASRVSRVWGRGRVLSHESRAGPGRAGGGSPVWTRPRSISPPAPSILSLWPTDRITRPAALHSLHHCTVSTNRNARAMDSGCEPGCGRSVSAALSLL